MISTTYSFSFETTSELTSPSDYSFESDFTGWAIAGDGDIRSTTGDVEPTHGSRMVGISTGSAFGGVSQGAATSSLTSGPISVHSPVSYLIFDYDFVSQEFDYYVGTVYDDSFTLTVSGPTGSYSSVVDSVNIIGTAASLSLSLPILSYVEHTGWKEKRIDIHSLGSPITLTFTISDVGDTSYESILFIDDIRFVQ